MPPQKVSVPKVTGREKTLQKIQIKTLQQQKHIAMQGYRLQQKMIPFFAEQAGITLQYNAKGKIIGATKNPSEIDKQNEEITKLTNERTLAALKGDLPVDPALEREITKQEQTLRERLSSQLGPGYETSTPGIQTLDEFFKTAEGLRYGARTGQLTLAEQLGMAQQENTRAGQAQSLNILRGSMISDPLSFASSFLQGSQVAVQGQQPYIQNRQMQLQAQEFNAQMQQQFMQGIGSLAGSLFGAIFPGG